MPFRFRSKYALLTYSQCQDLDGSSIASHLDQLGATYVIGKEAHADGGTHFHAFAMFPEKFTSSSERFADVLGVHPNIQLARKTPWKMYDYACKDGEVIARTLERPAESSSASRGRDTDDKWAAMLAAETPDEFWKTVRELDPGLLFRSFTSLQKYVEWWYTPRQAVYESPERMVLHLENHEAVSDWLRDEFATRNQGTSFFFIPSWV